MQTILKSLSGGNFTKPRATVQIKSDQILGTVRREAGLHDSKTKLAQRGPSHSSPLRSDGSHDSQLGGWTMFMVASGTQRKSWKTILVAKESNQNKE
jgi:hypothetical protein